MSEGDLGPRLPEEWEVGPNAQLARNLRKGRPHPPVGWADAEDPEPHDMSARELRDDGSEQEMCASTASKASFAMQFPSQLPSLRSEASFGMQFPSPVSEAGRLLGSLCSPHSRCDSEVFASEKLAGKDGDHKLYSQQVQAEDIMNEGCGEEEGICSISNGSQWLKEDRTSQVSHVVLAKWGHVVSQLMLAQEGEHTLRECWRADDAEKSKTKQFGASMEAVVMLWENGRKSESRSEMAGARRGRTSLRSVVESVIPKRTSWVPAGRLLGRSVSSGSLSGRAGSFLAGPEGDRRPGTLVQSLVWHPLCAKRTIWVILGLLFISYELLMLSLEVFELGEVSALGVMELITTIFWTIDIPLSFITGIFVKGEVEMRLRMIARSYATSWMSLDVMLVLVNWVLILIPKDGNTTALEVVRYVRHTRFLRLARLAKFDRLLRPLLQRINSTIIVLMIKSLIILMLVVLWVHCNGCIWFAIGSSRSTGWVQLAGLQSLPIYQQYLLSTHWAVAQLQGNVDIHPGYDNTGERAYAVIYTFASIGVLAAFVSKLTNIMLELQEINNKQAEELRIICDVLSRHRISAELSMRVRSYLRFKQTVDQKREAATKEVLDKLPIELRKALVHEMRTPHINGHRILGLIRQLHERTMRRVCCDAMQQHSPVLGEGIYSYGERCSAMYIVAAGDLTYHKYGVVAQVLMRNQRGRRRADNDLADKGHFGPVPVSVSQGRWLCEAALWVNWLHRGDLSVLSQAWYLTLEAGSFASIVADHLITKQALVFHASRFARSMDAVSMMFASDFFDTECAIEASRELIMPELDRWSTSNRSSESSG